MNCKYVVLCMQANASAHTLPANTQTHTHTPTETHVHSFWCLSFYTVLSYTGIMQCQSYFAIAFIVACCRHRHRQRQRQTTWQRWRQHSELETGIVDTARAGESWKGRGSWRQALRQKQLQRRRQASNYFVNTLDTPATTASGAYSLQVCYSGLHRISTSLSALLSVAASLLKSNVVAGDKKLPWNAMSHGNANAEATTVFVLPASHKWVWQGRAQVPVCVRVCVCKAESRQVLEPNEIT